MNDSTLNIAISTVNKSKYSETFITDLIDSLPANITFLHGDYLPTHVIDPTGEESVLVRDRRPLLKTFQSKKKILNKAIRRQLKRNKIKVILAEYGPVGVQLAPIASNLGIPLIVHFHGYDAYRDDILEKYGSLYRKMFADVNKVIGVSDDMCQRLVDLGAPPGKVINIPCGANLHIFTYRQSRSTKPNFITCSRFVEKKGIFHTIDAFNICSRSYPESTLTMIGEGPLQEQARQKVKILGLEDKVNFTGVLDQEAISHIYRNGYAFLQHSITCGNGDAEGTPLSVMEAGATGLPVIATNHKGIPSVVRHDHTGFLVEEGDIKAMADKMIFLIRNPVKAEALGKNAYKWVSSNFSRKQYINSVWSVLKDAIRLN